MARVVDEAVATLVLVATAAEEERGVVTVLNVLDWLAPLEADAVAVDVTVDTPDSALEAVDDVSATREPDADEALLVAAAEPLEATLASELPIEEATLLAADGASDP